MPTIVYLPETSGDGTQRDSGYSLIPRASQSVKVLSEVPMFCIILFQIHRHHIQNEVCFRVQYLKKLMKISNVFLLKVLSKLENAPCHTNATVYPIQISCFYISHRYQ